MTFYRILLASTVAIAIASPVFADDVAMQALSETAPVATSEPAATMEQNKPVVKVKVNANTAKAKDLVKVKGINVSKARAIVAYRKKHGEFKSFDDLAKVKALSKMKADDWKTIQDQLSLS